MLQCIKVNQVSSFLKDSNIGVFKLLEKQARFPKTTKTLVIRKLKLILQMKKKLNMQRRLMTSKISHVIELTMCFVMIL